MEEINYSREIWDLRGELDKAIIKKDVDKIVEIKEGLQDLLIRQDKKMFIGIGWAFESKEALDKHVEINKNLFSKNFNKICDKYIYNTNDSAKFEGEPICVAHILWVARAMYDDVLRKSVREDFNENENRCLDLMESVKEAVWLCRKGIYDVTEGENIYKIHEEVCRQRWLIFGDKKFVQGFKHNCKEY